jgi:hypothetical protein
MFRNINGDVHLTICVFIFLVLSYLTNAVVYVYVGPSGGLWSISTNWRPQGVPGKVHGQIDTLNFNSGVSSTCDSSPFNIIVVMADSSTITILQGRNRDLWTSFSTTGPYSPSLVCPSPLIINIGSVAFGAVGNNDSHQSTHFTG